MVARRDEELAGTQDPAEILEERPRRRHRVAWRSVAQLEHVAEQHQAIDALEGIQQGSAQLGAPQHVRARGAAQMQVGDDQRAHGNR